MKIAITIDDKLYERIKYLEPKTDTILDRLMRAVQNGTPLPKGHGRLIDADALKEDLDTITEWNGDVHRYVTEKGIDYAPTIIEADKETDNG